MNDLNINNLDRNIEIEIEIIKNSYFFIGSKFGLKIEDRYLDFIKLEEINFSTRFNNSARNLLKINNLTHLLNTDFIEFIMLPNCGKQSIEDARLDIINFLNKEFKVTENNENSNQIGNNSFHDNCKNQFPFLSNNLFDPNENFDDIFNFNLHDLNFDIKFKEKLKLRSDIIKVKDLLDMNVNTAKRALKCNTPTIIIAQNILIDYLIGKTKVYPIEIMFLHEHLTENHDLNKFRNTEKKMNINLYELDFDNRFANALNQFSEMYTVRDLLTKCPTDFLQLKNCSKKSIGKAQDVLLNLFYENDEMNISTITYHDEYVIEKLKKIIKDERNLNIYLQKNNYNQIKNLNLTQIGIKYEITRERVRQIVGTISRKIAKNKQIFSNLINEMKTFGYVFNLDRFLNSLSENKINNKINLKFLNKMILEFIINYEEITLSGKFVITVKIEKLNDLLEIIDEYVYDHIKDSKIGVEINEIINLLNENIFSPNDIEVSKFLNIDILSFISDQRKHFYVEENKIFNEMMYQIHFGKRLKEIVFWSMKYLYAPIHFSQLAEFVRKNNKRHNNSPDGSIHGSLMDSKLYNLAGFGTYVLKETNHPKYISATDSIKMILDENGPTTEIKIIEILKTKFNISNIKLSLKNNINKQFIKIGNDLYDLKL